MEDKKAEKITEEFFRRRFPGKDIQFEKECGYFGEWIRRFKSGQPEVFMDGESLKVWEEMKKEGRNIKELLPWSNLSDFIIDNRLADYEVKESIKRLKNILKQVKAVRETGYKEGKVMFAEEDVYGHNLVEKIIDKIVGDKLK